MPDLQQRNYAGQENYTETGERISDRPRIPAEREEKKRTMQVAAGGSALESMAGAGAIILAIISLSMTGNMAFYLMMAAIIVLGGGLVIHGASLAARINDLMAETAENYAEETEVGSGITLEVLGGVAGITLGILALVGFVPITLASVAIIVFGAVLVLGSGTVTEMNDLRIERARVGSTARQVSRQATVGAAGIQALAGVGAAVLGILAVIGIQPVNLVLVGIICVGAALLLSGGAISARMLTFLSRAR